MSKWCLTLALAGLALTGGGRSNLSDAPVVRPGDVHAVNRIYREVRLRKMHQVRPDLIPYPIDIEYYA